MKKEKIVYIGDMIKKNEEEMMRKKNLGRKQIKEIKEVMEQMGINIGMEIKEWKKENIEEIEKR